MPIRGYGPGWEIHLLADDIEWSPRAGRSLVQCDTVCVGTPKSGPRRTVNALWSDELRAPLPAWLAGTYVGADSVPWGDLGALARRMREDGRVPIYVDGVFGEERNASTGKDHHVWETMRLGVAVPPDPGSIRRWDLDPEVPTDGPDLARLLQQRARAGWTPYDVAGGVKSVGRRMAVLWMEDDGTRDWDLLADLSGTGLSRALASERGRGRSLVRLATCPASADSPNVRLFIAIFARRRDARKDRWVVGATVEEWRKAHLAHTADGLVPRTLAVDGSIGPPRITMVWGVRHPPVPPEVEGWSQEGRGWRFWGHLRPDFLSVRRLSEDQVLPRYGLVSWSMHGDEADPRLDGVSFDDEWAPLLARGAPGSQSGRPLTRAEFLREDDLARTRYRRLYDLEVWRRGAEEPRFLGMWEDAADAQDVETALDLDLDLPTLWRNARDWQKDGWCLVDLEFDHVAGVPRGHAIWCRAKRRDRSPPVPTLDVDLSPEALAVALVDRVRAGQVLTDIEPYVQEGVLRMAAVWQPSDTAGLTQDVTWAQADAEWRGEMTSRSEAGWLPYDVERLPMPGGDRFSVLWMRGVASELPRAFDADPPEATGRVAGADWVIDFSVPEGSTNLRTEELKADHMPLMAEHRRTAAGVVYDLVWWGWPVQDRLLGSRPYWTVSWLDLLGSGSWERMNLNQQGRASVPRSYDLCFDCRAAAPTAVTVWAGVGPVDAEVDVKVAPELWFGSLARRRKERWRLFDLDWKLDGSGASVCSAIWWRAKDSEAPVPFEAKLDLTGSDLLRLDEQLSSEGWALARIEALSRSDQSRYAAVWWKADARIERAHDLDLSFAAWRRRARERDEAGWAPNDITRATVLGKDRISTIWVRAKALPAPAK